MCLYPTLRQNPKYRANKKNGGNIPQPPFWYDENGEKWYDGRVMYVPTGCQRCIECRKQKAREWKVRLSEEIRKNKTGKLVTLTFSTPSLKHLVGELRKKGDKSTGYKLDNAIAKLATRRFLERYRKQYKKRKRDCSCKPHETKRSSLQLFCHLRRRLKHTCVCNSKFDIRMGTR